MYSTSGTAVNGLTAGTRYYVIVVDASTIQLAASLTDAQSGNALAIAPGGASHVAAPSRGAQRVLPDQNGTKLR